MNAPQNPLLKRVPALAISLGLLAGCCNPAWSAPPEPLPETGEIIRLAEDVSPQATTVSPGNAPPTTVQTPYTEPYRSPDTPPPSAGPSPGLNPPEPADAPTQVQTAPSVKPGESASEIIVPSGGSEPEPVRLVINNGPAIDTEIIQWPDGGFSLPVRTFAALFEMSAQLSDDQHRLFFADPTTGKRVDVYWDPARILVNDQSVAPGKYPILHKTNGFIIEDDVYIDQAVLGDLLQATFSFDSDSTTLAMATHRQLKQLGEQEAEGPLKGEIRTAIIRNPAINRSLFEKFYIQHNTSWGYQRAGQPVGGGLQNTYLTSMIDTTTAGVSGSLFGQDYYVKPSVTHYNGNWNLQNVDWSIQHPFKNHMLSLGSTEAGLAPLTSPSLNIWGLKFSSNNALTPVLTTNPVYEFSGKAGTGNEVDVRINNRTVQSVTANDGEYEFEPVYLQSQTVNHITIAEKDDLNHEKILLEKTIANFANLLPRGESGYSAFAGRVPVQFFPVLPNTNTPFLMPQSNKWLAGGRYFYGVNDRLTVGVSGAADRIFGKPRTYYDFLNPFSVDLTGISGYIRDYNFFNGENASMIMRYQLSDHWMASADGGISKFDMRPGTGVDISDDRLGTAGQLHLERQGQLMGWHVDAFHYSPDYYTPVVTLFGNTMYDKQGIGAGVNGSLSRWLRTGYSVQWNGYDTNLKGIIPGGVIRAQQINGSINTQFNERNNVSVNFNWIDGDNHEREFKQRNVDVFYRTQSLPWHLRGEVRASHYFTNTIFFPSRQLGSVLNQSDYHNNSLDTVLEIPVRKNSDTYVRVGNRLSTFVHYGFVQAFLRYHQFFFEPLAQLSYGDRPQTQNRFGARVGYQLKSGARFSIGYYRYLSTFSSENILGGGPKARINTDQIYADFTDVLSLLGGRPRSLGPSGDNAGIITGTVFADYGRDGKRDKSDPGIKEAQLTVDGGSPIKPDVNGRYMVSNLSPGYHNIEIVPESLPLTIGAENPVYRVKVAQGRTHRFDIGLTPEGGTLQGKVELTDIQGKALEPKKLVMVLMNQQGNVVNYTAVDPDGSYQFSNLPSGQYTIDLESKLKNSGLYRILQAPPALDVPVPSNYEESIDVKDVNFRVLAL